MSTSPGTSQLSPLFGRKWQVQVALPNANVLFTVPDPNAPDYDPQALRVTFEIEKVAFAFFWSATIVLWNVDSDVVDPIMHEQAQGMSVKLSAGYENGNYKTIWTGPIFQAFLERENVTDLKLTLHSLLYLKPFTQPIAGGTIKAFQSQNQIIQQIAKIAQTKTGVISSNLTSPPLPRSQVIFGNMSRHLDDIAADNNMQWWVDENGDINMGSIAEDIAGGSGVSPAPPLVFSTAVVPGAAGPSVPKNTDLGTQSIIGTPRQTMYGVDFRVLLDPRVTVQKPLLTVQINNTLIQLLKVNTPNPNTGAGPLLGLLDQNGVYVAIGVRHTGDTRGNAWYTDITGVTRSANVLAMLVGASALASTSFGSPSS